MSKYTPAQAEHVRVMAQLLAHHGWAVCGAWDYEQTVRIVNEIRAGAPQHETDEQVTAMWRIDSSLAFIKLLSPLARYGTGVDMRFQRQCQRRHRLLGEAIACLQNGYFAASTLLSLSQIDGLTRDLVGQSFFARNDPENAHDYLDDQTLAGISTSLPLVREAFRETIDTTGLHESQSRHGAMHGRDLSFGTKFNATKSLILVGALIEHLEERAADRSRGWRRKRDLTVRDLEGVDNNGRLRDDRDLEETYMFRLDLKSKWFNALLMDDLTTLDLQTHANKLLEQRRISRRNFTLLTHDRYHLFWQMRLPSGHYLASASRCTSPNNRPLATEEWTWDAAEAPSAAPWEDQHGWTEADGNGPRTPNWIFESFEF